MMVLIGLNRSVFCHFDMGRTITMASDTQKSIVSMGCGVHPSDPAISSSTLHSRLEVNRMTSLHVVKRRVTTEDRNCVSKFRTSAL